MYGTRVKTVKGFTTDNTFEDRINEVLKQIEAEGNIVLRIKPVQVDINSIWIMIEYEPNAVKTVTINCWDNAEELPEKDGIKVYNVKQPPVQEPFFYNDSKTNEYEVLPVITMSAAQ